MLERDYQPKLKKKLESLFPGCLILKNDSSYLPGIPDLVIFFNDRWAMLEVKAHAGATVQPRQEYYVNLANSMSFCDFIYPENEAEVLYALEQALRGV